MSDGFEGIRVHSPLANPPPFLPFSLPFLPLPLPLPFFGIIEYEWMFLNVKLVLGNLLKVSNY